jgi:hypothetical protein
MYSAVAYTSLRLSQTEISYGETLNIHAELEYRGPVSPILGFVEVMISSPDGRSFVKVFYINETGDLVSDWPPSYCISAGDKFVFDGSWDLKDTKGVFVEPGEYSVRATIITPNGWILQNIGQVSVVVSVKGSIPTASPNPTPTPNV